MNEIMIHLNRLKTSPTTFMMGVLGLLMMVVGGEHSDESTQNVFYAIGFASLLVGWLKTSKYFSTCRDIVDKLHHYSVKKNAMLLINPTVDVSNVNKSILAKTNTVATSYKNYTSVSFDGGMFEWINRLVFYCGFVISIGTGSLILLSISILLMTNHLTGVIMMKRTINKIKRECS